MIAGVLSGSQAGVVQTLNSKWSTCTPYPAQTGGVGGTHANFPITAAAFATACGVGGMTPSHIWDCQETEGVLRCAITDEMLVPQLRFGTEMTYGNATSGLEGAARTAIDFGAEGVDDGLAATSTELCNPYNGSCAWFMIHKTATDVAVQNAITYGGGLIGSPTTGEFIAGIDGNFDATGRLGANLSDGTLSVAASVVIGDQCDDTWNMAGMVYNATAQTVVHMHEGGQHSRDVSTFTWEDMQSYLKIGKARLASLGGSVTYVVAFNNSTASERTAAEACTQAGIATFWGQAVT